VSFTPAFAYVRLLDAPRMALLHLASFGEGKKPALQLIGLGSGPPKLVPDLGIADSVTQAATESAVFAVSPADGTTHFYMEGMNAPSGSFGGYGHSARAAIVLDRSVREVEPGVYAGELRIPAAGAYQVAFLLDSPAVVHCFAAEARENPDVRRDDRVVTAAIERPAGPVVAGSTLPLRLRVAEPRSGAPRRGLEDVELVYYRAPGELKTRVAAREVGDGVYEASLAPPRPGAYYVHVAVPSLGVKPGDLPFLSLSVRAAEALREPPKESTHAP
jgi:hypothetical protein